MVHFANGDRAAYSDTSLFDVNGTRNRPTATSAPTIAAAVRGRSRLNASPPTNRAGLILRAGFDDAPVSGVPTRCPAEILRRSTAYGGG